MNRCPFCYEKHENIDDHIRYDHTADEVLYAYKDAYKMSGLMGMINCIQTIGYIVIVIILIYGEACK